MTGICPNCGADDTDDFYRVDEVPTNSCLLVESREKAIHFPTGDIELAFCRACGFIFNAAFQPMRTIYSAQYEETQGYSSTFKAFHRRLAEDLIKRYQIVRKEVVEIGCGKGEFLTLLCELGHNRGLGFDPSFVPSRLNTDAELSVVREFFTESSEIPPCDFVCCKMTLEHIPQTRLFVRAVRKSVSVERGTIVFFQVPDVSRILDERAFWDIYYEHCCYFSPTSLSYLFRSSGFEVLNVSRDYDGQYLMIEARPSRDVKVTAAMELASSERVMLADQVARFSTTVEGLIGDWKNRLAAWAAAGQRVVLWGSGSKAVAFLTTTDLCEEVEYVVDINPHRQGKFIPTTGQRIVAPSFLAEYQPNIVIAMNPIYLREISRELRRHGCRAELFGIDKFSSSLELLAS
jgi:hypothetical protein